MDEDEEQQQEEDADECPDCLCPVGQPGEWEVWLFDCEQIVTYCGCGCHEGMEPGHLTTDNLLNLSSETLAARHGMG